MTLREVIEARPHPHTFAVMNISFTKQVVTMADIEKVVCEYLKITPERVHTKRRSRDIVKARQIIMYMGKRLTNNTLRQIGEHLGGYDHTTVLHSYSVVNNLMETEEDYKQDVINLLRYFGKSA